MKNNTSSTMKKIIKYLKKYIPAIVLSLIPASLSVIASLMIPRYVGYGIDAMIGEGLVDNELLNSNILKILVCVGVYAVCQWLFTLVINRVAYNTVKDIRSDAFMKTTKLPVSYMDGHPHGETVSRIISDTEQLGDGLIMGFAGLFTGIATIIGTLVIMFSMNVPMALAVVLLTPLSLFVARFVTTRTHRFFTEQTKLKGEQTGFTEESINGIKTVKTSGGEKEKKEKFKEINERYTKASLMAIFFSSLTNPLTRFVNSTVYAVTALIGAVYALSGGGFTVGMLSSFLSYSGSYAKPFNEISSVITEFQNSIACGARVFELIEEKEIEDMEERNSHVKTQGSVSFKNVYFSYTEEKPLIEDFSLEVKAGEHIAIVGPTGCGKTTLINILMRFYDAKKGDICIDGESIYDMPRAELRGKMGMVLQDTWIKRGTVKENIAIGKADATDEEIVEAAKACLADDFIKKLPEGYDTVIGSGETELSGGQIQLICIARVMLRDPSILILDEATSSIDTRSEMIIAGAFDKLTVGKTSFIVAHRLSTIINADLILVMRDGKIVEKGNHKELLSQKGFYYELYNSRIK
ncbi:MAG: ABC transporter ATP-binding protein [Ruminococcaceae bacterium]|nr:ABC transporter ATP-binding protein [Oscillospiraceae bacterium]